MGPIQAATIITGALIRPAAACLVAHRLVLWVRRNRTGTLAGSQAPRCYVVLPWGGTHDLVMKNSSLECISSAVMYLHDSGVLSQRAFCAHSADDTSGRAGWFLCKKIEGRHPGSFSLQHPT